jgi:small multidrug resistance pump
MFVLYGLCFTFLTLSFKKIDVSIAYAVWSGLGTALIASIGIAWFEESANPVKLISILLILAGVLGLKLGT